MSEQKEYNILIGASCVSTLSETELNGKLVASLYDIDTNEKISDGDSEKFEISDYNFTSVNNNTSIDVFILKEIECVIYQIIENNGYDKTLFNPKLFDIAIGKCDFKITEYEISRIYTLAEIYFQIMQQPTEYGDIIELIASFDISTYT